VLRPGSRIDQAELASNFGVSTVPFREALLRLQSAGLVEHIPHRGVFVSDVSVEELLDIYTTRELLEEQAARLAAKNLTPAHFATLEGITSGMETAANKQRLDELLSLNREFHFTIYRAAQRRHLLQLIEHLWDLSTRYAHLQLHTVPDRASEALYEIRSIVAACKRKDADALGLMIRYKVHQTTTGLLQHMSLPEHAKSSAVPWQSAPSGKKEQKRKLSGAKAKKKAKKKPEKKVKTRAGGKPRSKSTSQATKKAVTKAVARGSRKKRKVKGKHGT
jgi:DNA-binding GntR family transcriptional regulator